MSIESFYDSDLRDMRAPQIVVYFNPTDFPGKYVARLHEALASVPCGIELIEEKKDKALLCPKCGYKHLGVFVPAATNHVIVKDTLNEIRMTIPHVFMCMERSLDDDPCVVEVWI